MSGQVVTLYAEFPARPADVHRVEQLICGLAEKVRPEPGNRQFSVYREESNPRPFFVFEQYDDSEAFSAHIAADYGATLNAALSSLIEEDGSLLTFLNEVDPGPGR